MIRNLLGPIRSFPLRRAIANVRVRFAPSPTGFMHLGGLRMALVNYLYAQKYNGDFILRIEDTDQNRLVNGSIDNILETLTAFQLHPDESIQKGGLFGPYIQSQRLSIYNEYAQKLVQNGSAYYCFCTSSKENTKSPNHNYHCSCSQLAPSVVKERIKQGERYTIRLLMPDDVFVLHDLLRGEIAIKGSSVEDAVLIKSDGYPTYHLASVVDDHLMHISTVIRGEEWISSIPKHIQLYKCFGWEPPAFVHLPLILSEKKTKISKRGGGFELRELLAEGYLPSALLNYMYYLGLKRGNDKDNGDHFFYTIDSLVKDFAFEKLSSAPICVNPTLLKHINQHHIQHQFETDPEMLIRYTQHYLKQNTSIALPSSFDWNHFFEYANTRIQTLQDVTSYVHQLYGPHDIQYASMNACQYVKDHQLGAFFLDVQNGLQNLTSFHHEMINCVLMEKGAGYVEHRKKLMAALRFSLTNSKSGFGLSEMIELIGKEHCIGRIQSFINWIHL